MITYPKIQQLQTANIHFLIVSVSQKSGCSYRQDSTLHRLLDWEPQFLNAIGQRSPSLPCHREPFQGAAHSTAASVHQSQCGREQKRASKVEASLFVVSSQKWFPTTCAIFYLRCLILFIQSGLPSPGHTQGEEFTQKCKYQQAAVIRDHFRGYFHLVG